MDSRVTRKTPAYAGQDKIVQKPGGWITFPFIAGTILGLGLAGSGALSNMIVYLIKEFNIKSIDATQIGNIINGCTSLSPVVGAIISDAYFGCFPVVAFSTFTYLLSLILFTLTATIPSLRPTPCTAGSTTCDPPSAVQLAVLYTAVGLLSIGTGGTRFNLVTMGADQFDKTKDQDIFFNWYFILMYASAVIGFTVIVYIQDSVSWGLGFGLSTVAGAVSAVVLMMGRRYYRRPAARGSPFTGLARVVVASIRKRKLVMRSESYYHGTGDELKLWPQGPTQSFRVLNKAALTAEGDVHADGSIAKPWSLCSIEQVEDLKTLLRIIPLWTSSIFLSMSIGIQISLTILQALTMCRTFGRFSLPAASIIVPQLSTVALVLPLIDRLLIPLCLNLTDWTPSPLQRVGVGHVLNSLAMAASAVVESRRKSIVHAHHATGQPGWTVPMSVLWLIVPMVVSGLGEALHFPGQVSFYYQEFPESMRSTATGMVALLIAVGFYMSTAVVELVRRHTSWLLDNVNASRLDKVFWMLAVAGAVNFGYFVLCATLYKYRGRATRKAERPMT